MAKNNLHGLARSLSQNEKSYFKKYANLHGSGSGSNYIKLFNAIIKQTVYDEKAIKEQFKKETFIKQLHVTKNYLYNLILKALTIYHSENSIEVRLSNMMIQIDILTQRGLYQDAQNKIQKAQKIAEKNENLSILLNLNIRIKRSINMQGFARSSYDEIRKIHDSNTKLLISYKNMIEINYVRDIMFYNIRQKGYEDSDNEELDELINDFLKIKDKDSFERKTEQQAYCLLMGVYFAMKKEYEKAYPFMVANVKLYEDRKDWITLYTGSYISEINNLLFIQLRQKKYDEFKKTIILLDKVPLQKKNQAVRYFSAYHRNLLNFYKITEQFEAGVNFIPEVLTKMESLGDSIDDDTRLSIIMHTITIYFRSQNYTLAQKYINTIINDPKNVRIDIQNHLRLVNLLIHFEKRNFDLLESLVTSTIRYYDKNHKENITELILNLFLELKKQNFQNTQTIFSKYATLFKENISKKEELENYFYYEKWLKSNS